jgi:hypothetical protein
LAASIARLGLAALGVAAACVLALPARAALPPAATFVECVADGTHSIDPVFCQEGSIPGTPGFATASAFESSPFVTARATEPANGVLGSSATATLSYSFQVLGGNPGDLVPILIGTSLHTESSPLSSAVATLTYRTTAVGIVPSILKVCSGPGSPLDCIGFEGFSGAVRTLARPGSVDDFLALTVTASAVASGSSGERALATADPFVFIDPQFADAGLYSIVVSDGVGNVAAVPEPATHALFGSSLALLALVRFSRRLRR